MRRSRRERQNFVRLKLDAPTVSAPLTRALMSTVAIWTWNGVVALGDSTQIVQRHFLMHIGRERVHQSPQIKRGVRRNECTLRALL